MTSFIADPIVRSELMEQVPHIAVYCHEDSNTFPNAVPLYVLPMVVRYLNDPHNQVSVNIDTDSINDIKSVLSLISPRFIVYLMLTSILDKFA